MEEMRREGSHKQERKRGRYVRQERGSRKEGGKEGGTYEVCGER